MGATLCSFRDRRGEALGLCWSDDNEGSVDEARVDGRRMRVRSGAAIPGILNPLGVSAGGIQVKLGQGSMEDEEGTK